MAKTQAERAKEYRQKKRDVRDKMRDAVTAKCDENVTESKRDAPFVTDERYGEPVGIVDAKGGPYVLPPLPDDEVCGCNSDIGWSDILAMPLERIDLVYKTWKAIGNDVSFLLRLMRSAGYYRRVE